MSTREIRTVSVDVPLEEYPELPADWSVVDEADQTKHAREEWEHEETGLRVRIERQRRPTQMHTPETSTDDTGYITKVEGDSTEQITHDLSGKLIAYKRAYELMLNFPDGDFEPEWRDTRWEGPRDVEEWFE